MVDIRGEQVLSEFDVGELLMEIVTCLKTTGFTMYTS